MLVKQASTMAIKPQTISNDVPPDLLMKAMFLAGEPAWSRADVFGVIDALSAMVHSVLGVELWSVQNNAPRWIATSNYSYDNEPDKSRRIALCSQGAKAFVEWTAGLPQVKDHDIKVLYNLTWVAEQ